MLFVWFLMKCLNLQIRGSVYNLLSFVFENAKLSFLQIDAPENLNLGSQKYDIQ